MSLRHSEESIDTAAAVDVRRLSRMRALPIDAIRRHIRTHLNGRIRVSDIADIAGLDVSAFARALRREFHTTPYALVIAMRVEAAEHLLRNGMSVVDAAQSAGFCDQSHLTRHFRRHLGVTPSKVRPARKGKAF